MQNETLPQIEERILSFWRRRAIFEKSLTLQKSRSKPFRFFEGPPTANAGPGIHHALSRVFKDIVCRYKTMRGFYVNRKAGWDTHGLPVELQIEKELGIKHKSEIEKFGIAPFNKKAKEAVWRHKEEWERFTERIGFWLDLKNPYITYDASYMESLWWIIGRFWNKGLLEQDYKILPYCPRCETPLSSHEVALGYKTTQDPSVYIKLKILKPKAETKTQTKKAKTDNQKSTPEYLLVWTTTPWTLPANIAVAINVSAVYTKYKIENEYYWSATPPPLDDTHNIEIIEKRTGKSFLGMKYEPLFKSKISTEKTNKLGQKPHPANKGKNQKTNAFQIIAGDFVSTEEGTGFVHIAPAFGEDDMKVAEKSKLPIILNVSSEGKFAFTAAELKEEPFFRNIQGRFVKSADKIIMAELQKRDTLYHGDAQGTKHEYPFCWRCDTPLLYYAHKSWFVRMSRMRKALIANNEKINWVPTHIKDGRFGEWLSEVKDWAFSRERYWGTPLPIWECPKGHRDVISSAEELNNRAWQPNQFFTMRHGTADHVVGDYIAAWPEPKNKTAHLTPKGKSEIELAAKALAKKQIDLIVSSDLTRMKETAAILKKYIPRAKISYDSRLRELNCGIFNYQPTKKYYRFFKSNLERFTRRPPGGEHLLETQARYFSVWRDLNRKHRGKKILILGHGDPLLVLEGKIRRLSPEETLKLPYPGLGEFRELPPANFPYNDEGELDLHRPYVDEIILTCRKCKSPMKRIEAVTDVWFDSGAMPFAQAHFPFACKKHPQENLKKESVEKLAMECLEFPADYISEAVDQTRGWFYTLLAVSTALGFPLPPFRNVICLGHILDQKGEKMSKSKGNIVNPWEMISKYGADSMRWYFYTVNPPGEPKRFSENDLAKAHQELMVLLNVLQFYLTYAPSKTEKEKLTINPHANREKTKNNVLDLWITSRFAELTKNTTQELERYEITQAARQISIFIDDLSRWYVRRSRRRFQRPTSAKDLSDASATLESILLGLAKIIAPFTPFVSEHIWQSMNKQSPKNHPESVHLATWPIAKPAAINKSILMKMQAIRELAALGLKMRQTAGIKVRQPLSGFFVLSSRNSIRVANEFAKILMEELNVKKIKFLLRPPKGAYIIRDEALRAKPISQQRGPRQTDKWQAFLDTQLTAELKEEGELRELIRNIQELRQSANLDPRDLIKLWLDAPRHIKAGLRRKSAELKKEVNAIEVIFTKTTKFIAEKEYKRSDGAPLWVAISVAKKSK